jgi:hypothetical protein
MEARILSRQGDVPKSLALYEQSAPPTPTTSRFEIF